MSALNRIYVNLGEAKSRELYQKYYALNEILEEGKRSKQIGGIVSEGISRDFIREFLPTQFKVKNGLVIDSISGGVSPQIDAIIYNGTPFLEYTDVVIVEKQQVKALVETKSFIDKPSIFGVKATKKSKVVVAGRDRETGLAVIYKKRKPFLPEKAPYILFTFDISCDALDNDIINRLKQISDMYVVVGRSISRKQRRHGEEEDTKYNFDHSVSRLIKWLRNLR